MISFEGMLLSVLFLISNEEEGSILDYTLCKNDNDRVEPVFQRQCLTSMYKCRVLCVENEGAYVSDILQIVDKILNGVVDFDEGDEDEEREPMDITD